MPRCATCGFCSCCLPSNEELLRDPLGWQAGKPWVSEALTEFDKTAAPPLVFDPPQAGETGAQVVVQCGADLAGK